jgi:hypothetical protein
MNLFRYKRSLFCRNVEGRNVGYNHWAIQTRTTALYYTLVTYLSQCLLHLHDDKACMSALRNLRI